MRLNVGPSSTNAAFTTRLSVDMPWLSRRWRRRSRELLNGLGDSALGVAQDFAGADNVLAADLVDDDAGLAGLTRGQYLASALASMCGLLYLFRLLDTVSLKVRAGANLPSL